MLGFVDESLNCLDFESYKLASFGGGIGNEEEYVGLSLMSINVQMNKTKKNAFFDKISKINKCDIHQNKISIINKTKKKVFFHIH
jgi:hypothetical protein